MNNLYRELAPVTSAAWDQIEEEAARTFKRHVAGRRVVDVVGPLGPETAVANTGHLAPTESPAAGIEASLRVAQPMVRLRVPFTVTREGIDNCERGGQDSDWEPVKVAAKQLAFAEDRAIFEGYKAAGISGIRAEASNKPIKLPKDAVDIPDAIAHALTELRLAGVQGPYSVLLSADIYTLVAETSDQGYPILQHLQRLIDGAIIWAPAIDGAFVLTTRGGDFELQLGSDVEIGYLSHDQDSVTLYLQETFTFLDYTSEAAVSLG